MKEKKLIEKKRILAMSTKEFVSEKWKKPAENIDCFDCLKCLDCSNCLNCSYCRLQKTKRYMIANVQFTKEEYEEWKKKH